MEHSTLATGYARLGEGALEDAIEAFTACLQAQPQDADAYRGRAMARFQLKEWPAAAEDFARAKELAPQEQEHWIGLGLSLAMQSQIYEAIDVFEALLARQPQCVRAHLQLGLLYYQLCITGKGRHHLEAALACRPSPAQRRLIEQVLSDQRKLDNKRYYRPDFEALRRSRSSRTPGIGQRLRAGLSTISKALAGLATKATARPS